MTPEERANRVMPDKIVVTFHEKVVGPVHIDVTEWKAAYAQAIDAAVDEARTEKMQEWIDAELNDFHMMYDHLSRTYDYFSGGRISKPQTLPEEVFRVAADRQEEEIQEDIQEAVAEEREACAKIASNPYGDEVMALGPDEPKAVGLKIAAAIRARQEGQ